ncbi:hypothetical protein R0I01_05815 [Bacillus pumilus]|nr:hypothetical protein R0I01_05815 [Bacillus pumilus]
MAPTNEIEKSIEKREKYLKPTKISIIAKLLRTWWSFFKSHDVGVAYFKTVSSTSAN